MEALAHPYEVVFADYQRRALRALWSWPNREDALAIAWVRAVEYDVAPRHLLSWLIRVASREAAKTHRRDTRRVERAASACERASGDPAERVLALLECERRKAMVRKLSPPQRTALYLSAAGYSLREIGMLAGTGTGTNTWANRHVTEGRRALRDAVAA